MQPGWLVIMMAGVLGGGARMGGHDEAITACESRIEGLERLLATAMWNLRSPGADPECNSLRAEWTLCGRQTSGHLEYQPLSRLL